MFVHQQMFKFQFLGLEATEKRWNDEVDLKRNEKKNT